MEATTSRNNRSSELDWEFLSKILVREARSLAASCQGMDHSRLEQEAEDLVQGFLAEKLRRPDWVGFIHRSSQAITSRRLPARVRSDFRSFAFRGLKILRRMRHYSTFPIDHVFPEPEVRIPEDDLSEDLTPELKPYYQLCRQGFTRREIALQLRVSERTVGNKLGIIRHMLIGQ